MLVGSVENLCIDFLSACTIYVTQMKCECVSHLFLIPMSDSHEEHLFSHVSIDQELEVSSLHQQWLHKSQNDRQVKQQKLLKAVFWCRINV